jgi:hypothetical protein
MIRVRPFDPHTGFVAGYNPRATHVEIVSPEVV